MASVSASRSIAAPAAHVWKTLADFNGMNNWHPAVTASSMTGKGLGAERILTITDVATVVESLDEFDDSAMRFVYSASVVPFPVNDYAASMTVEADGENRCTVTWSGSFTPGDGPEEEMVAGLRSFYQAGLDGLAAKFE